MMDKLKDKFYKLFRCLIDVGKPQKKNGNKCKMERIELLWKEKTMLLILIKKAFELYDLLGIR